MITDPIDIKRIREYYEQLHGNKFNNLDKTDKLIEKHNQSSLKKCNILHEYSTSIREIEFIVKKRSTII